MFANKLGKLAKKSMFDDDSDNFDEELHPSQSLQTQDPSVAPSDSASNITNTKTSADAPKKHSGSLAWTYFDKPTTKEEYGKKFQCKKCRKSYTINIGIFHFLMYQAPHQIFLHTFALITPMHSPKVA